MPIKNPPHPGDFIRTEIIDPAGLSVTAAAAALQVSRPALSSLLNGKANLSGEMALRMEKAFGIKMDTLMRMQSSFDIAQIRKRSKEIHLQRISRLTEDQQDILISRARRNERSVPLKQVKANLIQRGRLSA
jgi:addiction module HigA family antidote